MFMGFPLGTASSRAFPLSMKENRRQMPSKRSKLINALTSEDPSNTVPKERREQRSHLNQAQTAQSPVHGGLVLTQVPIHLIRPEKCIFPPQNQETSSSRSLGNHKQEETKQYCAMKEGSS